MGGSPSNTAERVADLAPISNKLSFPSDHDQKSGMWLSLIEFDYRRPVHAFSTNPTATGTQINLPIPTNLTSTYSTDWDTGETSSSVQEFVIGKLSSVAEQRNFLANPGKFLADAASKAKADAGGSLSDAAGKLKGFFKEGGQALATDFLASQELFRQLGAVSGYARNPWLAAAFRGVNFRSWDFSYNFFPRNLQESQTLERIIVAMKKGMHPAYDKQTLGNNLFVYPNMYLPVLIPNKWLFDFGFCVITKFGVDYQAEGKPVYVNKDGEKIPASITISFGLQEIEVNTKESMSPDSHAHTGSSEYVQNNQPGGSIASGSKFRGR